MRVCPCRGRAARARCGIVLVSPLPGAASCNRTEHRTEPMDNRNRELLHFAPPRWRFAGGAPSDRTFKYTMYCRLTNDSGYDNRLACAARRGREFERHVWSIGHTAVENSSCTRPGTAAHRIAAAARDARQDEKAGNAENAEGIKEGNAGSGRKAKAAAAERAPTRRTWRGAGNKAPMH